jgi:hypothetical protein
MHLRAQENIAASIALGAMTHGSPEYRKYVLEQEAEDRWKALLWREKHERRTMLWVVIGGLGIVIVGAGLFCVAQQERFRDQMQHALQRVSVERERSAMRESHAQIEMTSLTEEDPEEHLDDVDTL